MKLYYKTYSNKGKRKNNEDDFFPREGDRHDNLFLVCDGIGGHGNGDIASAYVTSNLPQIMKSFDVHSNDLEFPIQQIHMGLKTYAKAYGNPKMGCTLAVLKFVENSAWLGWVGDTRVYHIRAGQIHYKTKDHTLVQLMLDNQKISAHEATNYPLKNVIYQAVGSTAKHIQPSVQKIDDVQENDIFLLGSDGFFEAWTDEELISIINSPMEKLASQLNNQCLSQSRDNFTFTLVKAVSS